MDRRGIARRRARLRPDQSLHHRRTGSRRPRRRGLAAAVRRDRGAAARQRSRRRGDWRVVRGAPRQEDIMNVFLAGGSGAIGIPIVRALVAAGHQVTAMTRSAANGAMLRALGATPAVADALDAEALRRVVVAARPTHVIHQLTALPKSGPRSAQRSRSDQSPAHRRHEKPCRCGGRRRREALHRRLVRAAAAPTKFGIPAEAQAGGRRRALHGIAGARCERARPLRRRRPALRPVLRAREFDDSADDRARAAPLSADGPRRPRSSAAHSRRRRGRARRSPRSTMALPGASTTSSTTIR